MRHHAPSLPPAGTLRRAEVAEILGVLPRRITKLVKAGRLHHPPTGRVDGLVWRHEVEALVAARAQRLRPAEPVERPPPELPPEQEATFEERVAAAAWTRDNPGPFVDTEGAARILGVSQVYVGMLAAKGRLPWLPTRHAGGGKPIRVFRRAQIEVIARARSRRQP